MSDAGEDLVRCRQWLDRVVEIDSRAGLYDIDDIREAMTEIIGLELGHADDALLAEYVSRVGLALEACAEAEKSWQAPTVNDRLDDAFEALAARGITSVQSLGITIQQGLSLAIERTLDDDSVRGVVFYHRQDLDSAVLDGAGLCLAFASFQPGDSEAIVAIGREIAFVLQHYGVAHEWCERPDTRIVLPPFEWKRRRVTSRPKSPPPPGAMPQLEPPPAPKTCDICGGKSWLPPPDPSHFPEFCVCQKKQ